MDFDLKKYGYLIIGVVLFVGLIFSGVVSAMTIDDLQNEIDMGNDVFLTDEITIYHDILNDPVILDLKGHTVTATEGKRHFVVNRGELRLVDSVGGGKLDGNNVGGGVKVVGDMAWTSIFNMQSGMITHCVAASGGAVECIVNGCFIMSGGKIFSCRATADNELYSGGGAIYLGTGAGNMFGGEITSCSAAKGGAVYISQNSRFTMYDGTLSHCRDNGGDEHEQDGVYTEQGMGSVGAIINSPGNFEFKGGNIVDCGKDAILIVDYGNCGANLTWELTDDGTLTISGTGAMYDYPYKRTPWYQYRSNMTELVLPEGLTAIGDCAFADCSNFTGSLNLPNTLSIIGNCAFSACSGFTGSLAIPNNVTMIDNGAFQCCSGFSGSLTIPNSVTNIGQGAFRECSNMTGSLILPNNITAIYFGTFADCSKFTGSLIIPDNVTSIEGYAFYDCSGLTSITVPASVTAIDYYAFVNLHANSIIYIGCPASLLYGKYSPELTALASMGIENTYIFTLSASSFPLTDENAPVQEGYSFAGWYDHPSYIGVKAAFVSNGQTLYAKWSEKGDGLTLNPGWNFISVPKKLSAEYDAAGEFFNDVDTAGHAILSYNAETKSWEQLSASTKISPLNAYWIYSVSKMKLPYVFGTTPSLLPTKAVYKGWNAVGLCAEEAMEAQAVFGNTAWYSFVVWDSANQRYSSPIIKGNTGTYAETTLVSQWDGGWLYVNSDGTYLGYA